MFTKLLRAIWPFHVCHHFTPWEAVDLPGGEVATTSGFVIRYIPRSIRVRWCTRCGKEQVAARGG